MSTDEQQPGRTSGSVPHAYGNALAWKWVPTMPPALKRASLHTLLYAMRSIANPNGELRFHTDHKPIRIQDIARAAGADEKDTRDRLEAAIRAGVAAVKGERRRGRPALYVLVVSPRPDWGAAVAYLDEVRQRREEVKRKRATRKAAPWTEETTEETTEKFGGRPPELSDPEFGGPPPELTDGTENEVRGTAPRTGSGDRPPNGSGDRPPNNPGITHELTHDVVDVVGQPQVDRGAEQNGQPQDEHSTEPPPDFTRCTICHGPMIPRPGRTTHTHCTDNTTQREAERAAQARAAALAATKATEARAG